MKKVLHAIDEIFELPGDAFGRKDDKDLAYYMNLPYSILLTPTQHGGWFAEIPMLPGCMTFANTDREVFELIEDAKRTWISFRLGSGFPIPEPETAR